MAQTKIDAVIDEIINALGNVSELTFIPPDPPEQVDGIHAVVFLDSGRCEMMSGFVTYWDTIVIQAGQPLQDLPRNNQIMLPIGRKILNALFGGLKDGTITPLNFERLEYEYGPYEWGGIFQMGWTVRVIDVKTQETI